jgi:hypothetical protein
MFQIYFHGKNYESLLGHIEGKYLPKKYGGTMDIAPINRMEFYQLLCKYEDAFKGESAEALVQNLVPLSCCRGDFLHFHHHSLLAYDKAKSLAPATSVEPTVLVPNNEEDVGMYGASVSHQ